MTAQADKLAALLRGDEMIVFKAAMGASDEALAALREQCRHPTPHQEMTIKAAFARVGADEWEPLRERFRDPSLKLAG